MSRRPATTQGAEPIAAASRFLAWRRERRRRLLRPLLLLACVACLLGVAAWVALSSSTFALRTVTIDGLGRVTKQEVLARAALAPGRSLLLIDTAAVAARVETLAPVAKARVSRQWPHGVVITVVERRPVAVVAGPSGWLLVDLDGVAFATASSPPAGLVPVRVGAPMSAGGAADARSALTVYRSLPRWLRGQVVQLQALSPASVTFQLRSGREVVWGGPTQNALKLAVLRALLPQRAVRYDVSAPDVAVTS